MASAVICLATGRKFNFSKYIFDSMVRNLDSPSKFLMYPRFLQVIINTQVADLTSHNIKYTSPALTHKVFVNMRRVGKGFFGVETPLFASMLVQPHAVKEDEEVKVPTAPAPPSLITAPSLPLQDPTLTPHSSPSSPTQEQPTATSESSMSLFNNLMGTCSTLRMHLHGGEEIEAIDADEDITLVDVETQVDMDAELQGRIDQDASAATKDVSAVEPTVFDDEEVTMTMAQTLIKMKAEKAKLLNEQIA
nr:hypothetical protein [Tanacetum cinerariifolium]